MIKQLKQVKKMKKGKKMSFSLQQIQSKQINVSHQISKFEKLAEATRNGTEDPPIRHLKKALTAVEDMEMDVTIRPDGPVGVSQCILSVDGVQIGCAEASTKKKAKRMAFKIALNLLTSGKPLAVKKSSEGFYKLGPKVGVLHSTKSDGSVNGMEVDTSPKTNDGTVSSKAKSPSTAMDVNKSNREKKVSSQTKSISQKQSKRINVSHQISKFEKLAEATRNGKEDPPIRHLKKALTAVEDMEMDVKIRPGGPVGVSQCILSVDGVLIGCAEASTKKKAKRMAFKIALNLLTSGKPLAVKKSSEGFYKLGPKVGVLHSTKSDGSVNGMEVDTSPKTNDGTVSSKAKSPSTAMDVNKSNREKEVSSQTKSISQKQSKRINVSHQISKFEKLAEATRNGTEDPPIRHLKKALTAVEDMEMDVKIRPGGPVGVSQCSLSVDGVQIGCAEASTKKKAKRMAFKIALNLLTSGKPLAVKKSSEGFYKLGPKVGVLHSKKSDGSVNGMEVDISPKTNDGTVSSKAKSPSTAMDVNKSNRKKEVSFQTKSISQKQSKQINVSHQISKFEKLAEATRNGTEDPPIRHLKKALTAVEDMEMDVKIRPGGSVGVSQCILSVDGVQIGCAEASTKKKAKRMAFKIALNLLTSGKPLAVKKSSEGFYKLGPKVGCNHASECNQSVKVNTPTKTSKDVTKSEGKRVAAKSSDDESRITLKARKVDRKQQNSGKELAKIKQPAQELVDVSRFVLMKPVYNRGLTNTNYLSESAIFNDKLKMAYKYEKVADKIKCTLTVGGLEVGSGIHTHKKSATNQSIDKALSFFEDRCYTIIVKEDIEFDDEVRTDEWMSVDDALCISKKKKLPKILDHIIKNGGCTSRYEVVPPKHSVKKMLNVHEVCNSFQDDKEKAWTKMLNFFNR